MISVSNLIFSIRWIFVWKKDKLWISKYSKENSFNSIPVIAWLSLKSFFVEASDLAFLIKNLLLFWLVWGVNSCHGEDAQSATEMVKIACATAKEKELVKPDDNVIITAGVPFGNAGTTNLLRIAKVIANKDLT